jgi:hypothetical protein
MSDPMKGSAFEPLDSPGKVLTHWLAYVTDRQQPYRRVWKVGAPIFAEIVAAYAKRKEPPLQILGDFAQPGTDKDSVDAFVSSRQPRVKYKPRYGADLRSVAKTLVLLNSFERNLVRYLSDHWGFCAAAAGPPSEGDTPTARVAFLLHLLTYDSKEMNSKAVSVHDRELEEKLDKESKRVMGVLGDQTEAHYKKWLPNRFHKRLWAALRDYVKPRSPLRGYFMSALSSCQNEEFRRYVDEHTQEILENLEVPGDIWNRRFFQKVFEKKTTKPEELRKQYAELRNRLEGNPYPEQFDFSFEYSARMCDDDWGAICPFRSDADSKIKLYCLPYMGIEVEKCRQLPCPVAMLTCGYEYTCEPASCAIREALTENLCPGCTSGGPS